MHKLIFRYSLIAVAFFLVNSSFAQEQRPNEKLTFVFGFNQSSTNVFDAFTKHVSDNWKNNLNFSKTDNSFVVETKSNNFQDVEKMEALAKEFSENRNLTIVQYSVDRGEKPDVVKSESVQPKEAQTNVTRKNANSVQKTKKATVIKGKGGLKK